MKVVSEKEISLSYFDAWSGGRDTLDSLTSEQCDTIEAYLEDLYPDGIDETQLNDFLWFERDTIAEWLGYSSWEALEYGEEEDEEEIDGVGYLNVYEPVPTDSQKSFYGKAIVIDDGSGKLQLKSYNTIVAVYNKRTKTLTVNGWYSATTSRHIRAFAAQLGINLPAGTKIAGKWKA